MKPPSKRKAVRPNRGNKLRPQAETPRHQFLYADFSEDEREKLHAHCIAKGISVSQFLADAVIEDVKKYKDNKQKVTIRVEFEVTPAERDKLDLLVRLHQKASVAEYVHDLLRHSLELQRIHAPLETISLRYYLSDEEHALVLQHTEDIGIAARNYGVVVALRALRKAGKRRK